MEQSIDTSIRKKNIIALDFDGVVCDGLDECLLSVWNTWHKLGVDAFHAQTLAGIPAEFASRFSYLRNFVRHSGHFLMAFSESTETFETAESFEAAYKEIPAGIVDEFLRNFEKYRIDVIENRYDTWIGMHRYYDGMVDVLKNEENEIFIVSGKDTHSIEQILLDKGIEIPPERIFGAQKNKIPALRSVAELAGTDHASVRFYDDNLPNVLDAESHGFKAVWAGWGYKTHNDMTLSKSRNVMPIELGQFVTAYS